MKNINLTLYSIDDFEPGSKARWAALINTAERFNNEIREFYKTDFIIEGLRYAGYYNVIDVRIVNGKYHWQYEVLHADGKKLYLDDCHAAMYATCQRYHLRWQEKHYNSHSRNFNHRYIISFCQKNKLLFTNSGELFITPLSEYDDVEFLVTV